jgi:hypothetical protein
MEEEQKISKKLFIDCSDAALLITMKDGGGISLYQRLQLFIHNIPCTLCRLWQKDSKGITKIIQTAFNAEKHCLSDDKKASLEKDLEELSS